MKSKATLLSGKFRSFFAKVDKKVGLPEWKKEEEEVDRRKRRGFPIVKIEGYTKQAGRRTKWHKLGREMKLLTIVGREEHFPVMAFAL